VLGTAARKFNTSSARERLRYAVILLNTDDRSNKKYSHESLTSVLEEELGESGMVILGLG
jgi:hypothetical protein